MIAVIPLAVLRSSLPAVAVAALLAWASPVAAQELPVLLVHGFCSSAETWDETLPQLSTRRYGDDAPRLYEGPNGTAVARTPVSAGSKTFRIDFSDLSGGFDLLAVANVPTKRKAGELKAVIDGIKRITGAPGVIVVGHSLGGLAARAYIQGTGLDRSGATVAYARDVAALVMISTPNQGSVLARLSGNPDSDACVLADTANLRDLKPTSRFLLELNSRPWQQLVAVHSIISNNRRRDSDDVVSITSQNLSEIPRYEFLRHQGRWRQSFNRDGILHLRVHNEPTTVSLFTGIVADIDNRLGVLAGR
jgi:pimeloyl-ACP methyl ester carboxylesterase